MAKARREHSIFIKEKEFLMSNFLMFLLGSFVGSIAVVLLEEG